MTAHSNARYERAVRRIAAEAWYLKTYQRGIDGMRVRAIGLDYFRVSLSALQDARLIRLIRVLENSKRSASFWYLLKSNEAQVRAAAKKCKLDLDALDGLATKLRGIRNKTFVHIDKKGVFDPTRYYKDANIDGAQLGKTIYRFWDTMCALYVKVYGKEPEGDDYSGEDIRKLAALRDKAEGV